MSQVDPEIGEHEILLVGGAFEAQPGAPAPPGAGAIAPDHVARAHPLDRVAAPQLDVDPVLTGVEGGRLHPTLDAPARAFELRPEHVLRLGLGDEEEEWIAGVVDADVTEARLERLAPAHEQLDVHRPAAARHEVGRRAALVEQLEPSGPARRAPVHLSEAAPALSITRQAIPRQASSSPRVNPGRSSADHQHVRALVHDAHSTAVRRDLVRSAVLLDDDPILLHLDAAGGPRSAPSTRISATRADPSMRRRNHSRAGRSTST